MSTADSPAPDLADLPEFELDCLFDNRDDPTEVTVFPAGDDGTLSTQWLSVDIAHAVSLDEVR
jgi:hypothetical protein